MRLKSLVLLSLLFGGCSLISVGYGYLDRVLIYKFNHYLDLTAPQEEQAEVAVTKVLAWHKSTQLPAYIAFLSDLQSHIEQGTTAVGVDYAFASYKQFRNAIFKKMIGNVAPIVFETSLDQKRGMVAVMAEDDQDIVV